MPLSTMQVYKVVTVLIACFSDMGHLTRRRRSNLCSLDAFTDFLIYHSNHSPTHTVLMWHALYLSLSFLNSVFPITWSKANFSCWSLYNSHSYNWENLSLVTPVSVISWCRLLRRNLLTSSRLVTLPLVRTFEVVLSQTSRIEIQSFLLHSVLIRC